MASRDPLYLHKETRLSFEPPSSSLAIEIKVPSVNSQGRGLWRNNNGANGNAAGDEKLFRDQNCATASSVYQRRHHSAPRSFLWRVLDSSTLLSIRTIDVCKAKKAADTNLILNFRFPRPIRPNCVAFADSKEHDTLSVFVVDTTNHLYTLTLRPEFFRKRSATESGFEDHVKIHNSSAFSLRSPHRLVAASDDLLVATVYDGGNIRLDRNKGHDAQRNPWKETFQNAKGWAQNIRRGLLGAGGTTVKYEGLNMETTAAAAVATSDLGFEDTAFLFTVCLDHRLRTWSLRNGQILDTRDLLDAERNPQETGKWSIAPAESNLIRIIGETEGRRLCVTFSPVGAGEFKFWKLEADGSDDITITDAFPDNQLIPSPPSGSDVWTLADFSVIQDSPPNTQLWVLWKNNMTYRVQHLSFVTEEIEQSWSSGWSAVYGDVMSVPAQSSSPCDPTDTTEKWLQLILYPGRFTKATLETALSIYEQGLGVSRDSSTRAQRGLAESICSVLASTVSLERNSAGIMDYEQYRNANETQWRRFYRLLIELDKQRGEALALVYETDSASPWVVCADNIAAIRACSEMERICYNPAARRDDLENVSTLVVTALNFVDIFSDSMLQVCNGVLRSEIFESSSKTDYERIQYFSDKAAFWRQTSDEDCAQVTDALGENFRLVTMDLYQRTLALMRAPADSQEDSQYPLTDFGRKLAVRAMHDMAELQWNVCFSQLILLVHMEFEFDKPEDAIHNKFDIGTVYRHLISALKRLELVRWLAKTQITVPLPKTEKPSPAAASSPAALRRSPEDSQVITVLEGNVGHLLGIADLHAIPSGLTDIATNLCAEDSDIQLPPVYAQCALLMQNRPDLALELSPFNESHTPFVTYIQGRVHLALRDFPTAATYFKKAAYGMGARRQNQDRHSSGLLDDSDWLQLNRGMPRYYGHIVALFEKAKSYSYVVDFARRALQFVQPGKPETHILDIDIHTRMFNGALYTSQFDVAHAALVLMTNNALQLGSLRLLIQKMCENLHNAELVALPFPNLENAVDDILAEHSHNATDVVTGIPYHQILYAWRIKRNNYRGAAAILLDRIHKLRKLGEADQPAGDDVLDTVVTRQYLMLINVLSCVEHKQAWIASEQPVTDRDNKTNGHHSDSQKTKRKILTLADIRKEYQDELDRIAAIQNNQFGFAAGDEMEVL